MDRTRTEVRVAVVGAGIIGLSICYHLQSRYNITLFEKGGVASGASGVSAGLIHPNVGFAGRATPATRRSFSQAIDLIERVAPKSIQGRGLLRLPRNDRQAREFAKNPEWNGEGLLIPDAAVVDMRTYLDRLFGDLEVELAKEEVGDLSLLESEYDYVVVAAGAGSAQLLQIPLQRVETLLRRVKGQLITPALPEGFQLPATAAVSGPCQVLFHQDRTCTVAATFEHDFTEETPDLERARAMLQPKLAKLFPELAEAEVLDVRAGVRLTTDKHKPLIQQTSPQVFACTAFGAKGGLQHVSAAHALRELLQVACDSRQGR